MTVFNRGKGKYQYGSQGKVYKGKGAETKAKKQAAAAHANKHAKSK